MIDVIWTLIVTLIVTVMGMLFGSMITLILINDAPKSQYIDGWKIYWSCASPNDTKKYVAIKTQDFDGNDVFVCVEGKEAWISGKAKD